MPASSERTTGYGRLRNHPRSKGVLPWSRWKPYEDEKPFQTNGVTEPIHRLFTPGFKRPHSRPRASSSKLGTRVHKQIEDIIRGREIKGRIHKFTRAFFNELQKLGLRAVDAEPPIISLAGNFMTQPDVICLNSRNEMVVVSIKTGFNYAYNNASPRGSKCAAPFTDAAKSERSQHQLQLAAEVATLRHEYKFNVTGAYVIYLGFDDNPKRGDTTITLFEPRCNVKTDYLSPGFCAPASLRAMFIKMKQWSLRKGRADLYAVWMSRHGVKKC